MHRAEVNEHMSAVGLAEQLRDELERVSGKCAAAIKHAQLGPCRFKPMLYKPMCETFEKPVV